MISFTAFSDELEKIAVSPGWIAGKLEGMASKVVPKAGGHPGLMERASKAANPASSLGKVQNGPAPLPSAMTARPTAPKTVAAQGGVDAKQAKTNAYNKGRESIQNAASRDFGRGRIDGRPWA